MLTGRKCTFLGSCYPRGIAIFGRLTVILNAGIGMNRKLNEFPSQRKKKWVIWMNGSITVKENVLIPIFRVDTLLVCLKLVYSGIDFTCLHEYGLLDVYVLRC